MNNKISDYLLNFVIAISAGAIIYASFFAPNNSTSTITSKNIEDIPYEETEVIEEPSGLGLEDEYFENYSFSELADPKQTKYRGNDYIPYENGNIKLKIYPKAKYQIYAMVMSKKKYSYRWESKISPYDLALAWNKLMLPQYQKGISYSQSGRWYYYRYQGGYPLNKSYISKHSANNHILPANDNVKKAIARIRKKDKIYLEGYLVYVFGTVNGGDVWWKSSLSRNDTGDHACEVFYVTKAILKDKIYE